MPRKINCKWAQLDVAKVAAELLKLTGAADIALVCYKNLQIFVIDRYFVIGLMQMALHMKNLLHNNIFIKKINTLLLGVYLFLSIFCPKSAKLYDINVFGRCAYDKLLHKLFGYNARYYCVHEL